jgi:hypothetical protein
MDENEIHAKVVNCCLQQKSYWGELN